MTLQRLAIPICALAGLLAAQPKPTPEVQATTVEHVEFPAGGTLHLERLAGEVTVEGWDRSDMEMTITKAPPLTYDAQWHAEPAPDQVPEKVKVTAERQGNAVVVRATYPRRRVWVTYSIRVPRAAGLIVDRNRGEVHVADLGGDIHATTREGEISLLLPPGDQYAIDARTDFGDVYSDFPGAEHRRFWLVGHRFAPEDSTEGHKLYLRAGYGDIIIQKIRRPPYPAPLPEARR
jgi:hypothetical protein